MDHDEALAWLYARQDLGIKLGLDKVHDLLARLGNPHHGPAIVHIAGTNGKGSVAALMDAALREAGHRVGLFTSPHLVHFSERIRVNGAPIPDDDVARIVDLLRPVVEELDAAAKPPTFFELVAAMAFLHFRDENVDWMVLETGMGGRLDATNVVDPALCIITNVAMDHQAFLGDTIEAISAEKAGIMKPGIPCVTAATGAALQTVLRRSHEVKAPMSVLDRDYHVVPSVNGIRLAHPAGEAHYDVALVGEHQVRNAALAVVACDALRSRGHHLPPEAVQRALAATTVPGRLEQLHPAHAAHPVLLDGAHNIEGAVALRRHFAAADLAGFQLIVGFNADKNWEVMLGQWAPLAARVHGVPLRTSRTLDPEAMRASVEGIGIPFEVHPDAATALEVAAATGPTVVAGSLFLVGEARAWLTDQDLEDIQGDQ